MNPERLTRSLTAAFALATLALFGSVGTASASFPGVNGKVAFQYMSDIATVNPDGTGLTVIAVASAPDVYAHPAWSPDGLRIAFDDGNSIYVVDADGSNRRTVANGAPGSGFVSPAWSHDGRRLAFNDHGAAGGSIFVIDADGGNQQTVIAGTSNDFFRHPTWSPDGSQIAFSAIIWDVPYWVEWNIARVNVDGTGLDLVTFDHQGDDHSPDWSPSGTPATIVFSRSFAGAQDVRTAPVVNPSGTSTNLTQGSAEIFSNPDWSPDGSAIVVGSEGVASSLWTMLPDGSGLAQIATVVNAGMPDWQPLVSTVPGVPSATGAGPLRFATGGGVFTRLVAVAESSLPAAGKPAGVTFPYGFFDFTIGHLAHGATVTVALTFPASVPSPAQYWKVVSGIWDSATASLGSDDGDAVLTLTLTDGGQGDADGVANGEITDPGGVGVADEAPADTPCTVGGLGLSGPAPLKSFAFAARYQAGAPAPQGVVVYTDRHAGKCLHSVSFTRLTCVGARADISGSGFVGGSTVVFTLRLEDRGPSGTGDTFAISWPGYAAAGPVAVGNVLVRRP